MLKKMTVGQFNVAHETKKGKWKKITTETKKSLCSVNLVAAEIREVSPGGGKLFKKDLWERCVLSRE